MFNFSNPQMVLFHNGEVRKLQVFIYEGAALAGSPTAYVMHGGEMVWVVPGQSVAFVQA